MSTPRSNVWPLAAVLLSAALLIAGVDRGTAREAVASLLSTTQTVVGQPIVYPTEAPAKVAAAVVTMQPGEETGWHQHDVPMFGYILDGEGDRRLWRQGHARLSARRCHRRGGRCAA